MGIEGNFVGWSCSVLYIVTYLYWLFKAKSHLAHDKPPHVLLAKREAEFLLIMLLIDLSNAISDVQPVFPYDVG